MKEETSWTETETAWIDTASGLAWEKEFKTHLRAIPNHQGYFAEKNGNIWSQWTTHGTIKNRVKKLSAYLNRHGYLTVGIKTSEGFKTKSVHHLVLITYSGPKKIGMEARHLDGNKKNNKTSNLKWGTSSENAIDRQRHGTESSAWVGKKYCTKKICIRGHILSEKNRNKRRQCRLCKNIHNRNSYIRAKLSQLEKLL